MALVLGGCSALLADHVMPTTTPFPGAAVNIILAGILGVVCAAGLAILDDSRKQREKVRRLNDKWRQDYNAMFHDMHNRLLEAQRNNGTPDMPPPTNTNTGRRSRPTRARPPATSPADEYFDRLARPRRFLTLD